jgi:hypothetical protein
MVASKKLRAAYPMMRAIATTNPNSRQSLLVHLDEAGQAAVCHAIKKCILGNKSVMKPLQEVLKPDRHRLRQLANHFKKHTHTGRKRLLRQSESSIGSILLSVLPLIAPEIVRAKKQELQKKEKGNGKQNNHKQQQQQQQEQQQHHNNSKKKKKNNKEEVDEEERPFKTEEDESK